METENMIKKILEGDKGFLAKAITLIENQSPEAPRIMKQIYPKTGKAKKIGITGVPGAGKSTLISKLVQRLTDENLKIGILAVDPSSPLTGGALLGDRVRFEPTKRDGVFFRSVGSRGSTGGLSKTTHDIVRLMDAYGMDIIFIETVGAGQGDVDIIDIVDTCLVVLMPELGDEIQALKAGILEIGDIFVINKIDLEGSERIVRNIQTMIDMKEDRKIGPSKEYLHFKNSENTYSEEDNWSPSVIKTRADEGEGVDELVQAIKKHWDYLEVGDRLEKRRKERRMKQLMKIIKEEAVGRIQELVNLEENELVEDVIKNKKIDPRAAAKKILSDLYYNEGK